MGDLITNIQTVITWIMTQFGTLFTWITTDHPVALFPIGLALVGVAVGIVFKVTRGFGLRSRRR